MDSDIQDDKISESGLHQQVTDRKVSKLARYQDLVVGNRSLWYLFKYELIAMFVTHMPGALGLILRKMFYPSILGHVGANVIFGRGTTIRHGLKIKIGDNTVVDDNVTFDAKGSNNGGIEVGDDCIVSRNSILACKNGNIKLGARCSLGISSLIHAAERCDVQLGDDVLLAANVYLVGSGVYGSSELDVPFKKQGIYVKGGINLSNNVWVGSNAQVLDGVSIGTGAIVGSSAVVTQPVNAYEIVAGIPAKVIRTRS